MGKKDKQLNRSTAAEPLVDFDAWFAERHHKIPVHHYKEILKADFKAQGLMQGTMRDFDNALEKYGVKLK